MDFYSFSGRLLLAIIAGALVGFEREFRHRSAGIRTHALVSMGAACFVLLSLDLTSSGGDPTRIIGQVVTGVGFLGAGVIMRDGVSIMGLNTAATVWCSSAIGCFAGAGFFIETILITLGVLLAHLLFRPIESRLDKKLMHKYQSEVSHAIYEINVVCSAMSEDSIRVTLTNTLLMDDRLHLKTLKSKHPENASDLRYIEAEILAAGRQDALLERVVARVNHEAGVRDISWHFSMQTFN